MKKLSLMPYYRSFFQNNLRDFLLGETAVAVKSGCAVGVAWLIQQLLDACTGSPEALPFRQLLGISLGLIALYLGVMQLERITTSRFMSRALAHYKRFLFSRLSAKSIAAFRKENTAVYLTAVGNDARTVEMGVCVLFNALDSLLRMGLAVLLMLRYSPVMTLGALGIAGLTFLLSIPTSRRLVEAERELSDCNERVTGGFKDFLTGFPVVKSFQAEREMGVLFRRNVEGSAGADRKRRMQEGMFDILMEGGLAAARVLILLMGVWMAVSGRGVSAGMVVAFVQLLDQVVSPMQSLPLQIADFRGAQALIRKAAENLEKNIRDEGETIPPTLESGLELRNLTFGYEPERPVLRGISHRFEAGKRYALVGSSGCGKSTLLQLLMGGSAYEGSILLDGHELSGISSGSLYGLAALISQNVFLFNATILENITMFRDFPPEEVERAAALSGLSRVIREKGPDFLCGENGCKLSGGEKQRISIARSLLRKSRLLLDLSGVTELVVTHSLEPGLLRQYDEILAMQGGRLAETGSFEALMEKKGYFYSLYRVTQA